MKWWFFVGCFLVVATVALTPALHADAVAATGSRIVFTGLANNNEEIFSVNEDGSDLRNLTQNRLNDFLGNISRDGTLIAYAADTVHLRETQVFVMKADGTEKRQLTFIGNNYTPAISPDGKQIVFHSLRDGNREIYLINTDGTGEMRLTFNPAEDSNASFNRDGSRILFQSNRDGNGELYTMNLDGSDPLRLTNDPADDGDAAYSLDGSLIAFSSKRGGKTADIYLLRIVSGGPEVQRVTHDPQGATHPSFSPDGTKIVYQSGPFYTSKIYVVNIDGSDAHPLLPNGPDGWSPHWGVRE